MTTFLPLFELKPFPIPGLLVEIVKITFLRKENKDFEGKCCCCCDLKNKVLRYMKTTNIPLSVLIIYCTVYIHPCNWNAVIRVQKVKTPLKAGARIKMI
jgi:hypothetical protein